MTKRKINAVYPGVTVKAMEENNVRAHLGVPHWNLSLYGRYCDGKQSGTVTRMVGLSLALVKFTHCDGTVSSLTFPVTSLVRCDMLPSQPSLFSFDSELRPTTPCVVCGTVGSTGEKRASGFKCSSCIGTRSRFRLFKRAKQ
eukprot:TRINITY_DN11855_c1_g1_i1.p1 TRINITY_DN11855_c1_g1~~TRINITY_DN11855_c1_g1_i1.p1  ORF type:complete len:158 (+),score=33.37 TRINITY_DN11855_c1_g1_i1:50-475(+)